MRNVFSPLISSGRRAGAVLALAILGWGAIPQAQAVPSYARQTGADCAACHVGAYGPQLTPYGIKFKIGGYTDTDGQGDKVPLSAMLVAGFTKVDKKLPAADVPEHAKSNNNAVMQEASVFLAGRLSEHIGSFVQVTYDGVERKSGLDQLDLRLTHTLEVAGKDTVVGVSVNSNPTLTDPFNSMGQWRFPYTDAGALAPGNNYSPLVESLAGSVLGVNAYGFWDNRFYGEVGVYNSLSRTGVNSVNSAMVAAGGIDPGKFKGVGTYWRAAYFQDMKRDNFSVGLFGFNAQVQDAAAPGTGDRYQDIGLDGSYQFLGNRQHVFTANASYVREWQKLGYTQGVLAASTNLKNTLDHAKLAASYHYNQTWGVTAGLFDSKGSRDLTAYGASLNGKPNTSGYILQADWTPWGKETSWLAPMANVRLGLQYTGFQRYEGGSRYTDNDGNLRRASDNNTLMLFLWTAI